MEETLKYSDIDIIYNSDNTKTKASAWPWEKTVNVFNKFADNPEYQQEIGICRQLLSRIISDSLTEFLILIECNNHQIGQKQLLAIMTINAFNITDDKIESGECLGLEERQVFDGNFSFYEAIQAIEKLAGLMGENLGNFHQRVDGIVEAQLKGMGLVQQSKEAGRIVYTVDQALEYRVKTVKEYYKLLADIGIKKRKGRKLYVEGLMLVQHQDDKVDIIQDLETQVNPFLAVIAEMGWESVLKERITNYSGQYYKYDDLISHPEIKYTHVEKLAMFEKKIEDAYSE